MLKTRPFPALDARLYGALNDLRLWGRDLSFMVRAGLRRLQGQGRGSIVLCNSFPKSGTHLLYQVLLRVPGFRGWRNIISVQALTGEMNREAHVRWKLGSVPAGSVVRSHLMHGREVLDILASRDHKRLFIYRDPRDVAVSHAAWAMKERRYYLHSIYRDHLRTDDERLMASIVGVPLGSPFGSNASSPSIGQDFSRWQGWLRDPATLAVRYEDLVGRRGGGDDGRRLATIRGIVDHLGRPMSDDELCVRFAPGTFDPSRSHTFRRGVIGSWRQAFSRDHVAAFKAVAGRLLVELGYEEGGDWTGERDDGASAASPLTWRSADDHG